MLRLAQSLKRCYAAPRTDPLAKHARISLLNGELSELRGAAVERTRTMDTRASFLVVAAGFLAGVAGTELISEDTWFLGVIPLILTLSTVVVSAFALWPRKLSVPSARQVVSTYIDADLSTEALEDVLLEIKTVEVEKRNAQNETKAEFTKWGFVLLIAAMGSAFTLIVMTEVIGT